MAATDVLEFKLTIDGKEAIAVLDLTKGEFVELNDEVKKVSGSLQTAFDKITKDATATNTQLQNTNVQVKGFNASTQSTIPGVNNMTLAISQFGWVLGDANMFLVNARMGMMSIANNIPMIVQAFTQARQAAQGQVTVMQQLAAAISGGGGLLLGINALMFVMQLLPSLFDDTTKKVAEQTDAIKTLKEKYADLTKEQLNNYITAREEELRKLEEKYPSTRTIVSGTGFSQREITLTEKERYGSDYERYQQLQNELKALKETERDLGKIENIRNRIKLNQEQLIKMNENEASPFYWKNLVQTAKSYEEARETMEKWIEADEKFVNRHKTTSEELDKAFKKAEEELVLSQEHAIKMQQIENDNDAIILEMKKQHLTVRIKLYEKYGKDVTALMYELVETEAALQKALKAPDINADTGEPEDIILQNYKNKEEYEKDFQRSQLDTWYAAEDEKIKAYENYNELKIALDEEYARRKKALEQQSIINTLTQTSQLLSQLAGLFGRHTAAYKLLAVAQVWIETYKAVAALYAPPPIGVGPVLAPFMTAAVIGMGAMQVANIMKQDTTMKGYARGGAIVGEYGPEIIAPAEDYATGMAELINRTVNEVRNYLILSGNDSSNTALMKEIQLLRNEIRELASRPVRAYLDNDEAVKIGQYYDYEQRTSR